MPAQSTIVETQKVDELTDALAKLTIGVPRLQPGEKARLIALARSLGYSEPIGQLDPALNRNNRPMGGNHPDSRRREDIFRETLWTK